VSGDECSMKTAKYSPSNKKANERRESRRRGEIKKRTRKGPAEKKKGPNAEEGRASRVLYGVMAKLSIRSRRVEKKMASRGEGACRRREHARNR